MLGLPTGRSRWIRAARVLAAAGALSTLEYGAGLARGTAASHSAVPVATGGVLLGGQTRTLPSTQSPQFQAGVQNLWNAIVEGRPQLATSFYFPLHAYVAVKAITNGVQEWTTRLLVFYQMDIMAAHAYLGAGAASDTLIGVWVPRGSAVWVQPGVELNKGSYWLVYGARLLYRSQGRVESLGIRSLISWKGQWYIVHLGHIARATFSGDLYQPYVP